MKKIHYTKPSITKLEIEYVNDAIKNGWGEHCYDYINKFEKLFRKYLGVKYAISTSSCTGAIHMGLSAIGIKPGDEVILADINWIASAAPITYLGAKPVFVDVLPNTWCIDPSKIAAAITPKTKAIITVHLYGNLCEMDEIMFIAREHNLIVVEDAAEGIGSTYKGKKAGSIGDFGTFSFHGTKTITTGEGGMFVTNNKIIYEKVLTLSNHGRSELSKQFCPDVIGFKYKMSNLQAAIGCAQMERIEDLIQKKRDVFFNYYELFKQYDQITMNPIPKEKDTQYGYWMPTIVFDNKIKFNRDNLVSELQKKQIDGRVFFYPLSMLNFFNVCTKNKVSYGLFSRSINLPSYYEMDLQDINYVFEVIKGYLWKNLR